MKNQIRPLLSELSRARMTAPPGIWSNSPDLAGWLLEHGQEFIFSPHKDLKKTRVGHCYQDSQELALKNPHLTYCEGYVQLGFEIPVPHAWCVNGKCQVVDVSLRSIQTPERFYFGVPINNDVVGRFKAHPGTNLSILFWNESNWPLQNGTIPELYWRKAISC